MRRKLLLSIVKEDGIDEEIISDIIREAEGCPRQALIMLEQITGLDKEQAIEVIRQVKVDEKQIIDLCRALLEQANWKKVSGILKGIEAEPEKIRRAVLGYFSSVLLNKDSAQAALIIDCFRQSKL